MAARTAADAAANFALKSGPSCMCSWKRVAPPARSSGVRTGRVDEIGSESPIIRFVNYLVFDAIKQGASDIHIEPKEKELKVRYRIDGVLFESMNPPKTMHAAVVRSFDHPPRYEAYDTPEPAGADEALVRI